MALHQLKPAYESRPPCRDYLFIWHNGRFKKVTANTITYLEASRSYCELHLAESTTMVVSVPLSEVVKHLCPDSFIRIHRSYCVNLPYIDNFIGKTIGIKDGTKLPIGHEYRKAVIGCFTLVGTKSRKYLF